VSVTRCCYHGNVRNLMCMIEKAVGAELDMKKHYLLFVETAISYTQV
jgi:hypothetical protein